MAWSAGAVLTAAQLNTYVPQAWGSYAPGLGGTGTTQGNATMTGGYMVRGRTCDFWAQAVLGSTSVIGSQITLQLPFTAAATNEHLGLYGKFNDASSNFYLALPYLPSTLVVGLGIIGTNGAAGAVSATAPFTWVAGDSIFASGSYALPS